MLAAGCLSLGTSTGLVETSYWGYAYFQAEVTCPFWLPFYLFFTHIVAFVAKVNASEYANSPLHAAAASSAPGVIGEREFHGVEIFLGLRAVN